MQVNPRTGSRLKAEVRCDGAPVTPASPRFARHNHNHLDSTNKMARSVIHIFTEVTIRPDFVRKMLPKTPKSYPHDLGMIHMSPSSVHLILMES
ncbi:hypothetical protein HF086_009374 [Spodoptera exigua]|uniref:Uncharacterized protein n=1 Tax=Spodoptera exigua TaxID=7107 RepID=A0A922MJ11_SPOEX|nr:hypothetical protein HF086_009374 [Spodoptera exigua]